jgi:beta-galactosidase
MGFSAMAQRDVTTLNDGWKFSKGSPAEAKEWQTVRVPHDWAIYGPFDRANDLQVVAVEQNGETEKTEKTGRTGGLPFIGKGTYRTTFEVPDTAGRSVTLVFDGAMSNAHVKVNGKEVAFWPYGYNSFYVNVDDAVVPGANDLEVALENFEKASRWYPGAGLYRNVHVVNTSRLHIPTWGTYVTTPRVGKDYASVKLQMKIDGATKKEKVDVKTVILDPQGRTVATDNSIYHANGQDFTQNFLVNTPDLWSPENPALYTARTTLSVDGKVMDSYDTRFGIRSLEYVPEKGFFLNGEPTKFKGVCNHHDLGPLGAAVNRSALRHQIELLKDMGVNAIRTAHNMPAPELVELCDELGMMLMIEPFDDWSFRPKSPNGYGSVFNDWAEKDITNMVERYRNAPSVVMWSIGNEVPSQWGPDGVEELVMLQDLVHKLDPTRPVTCGMDQIRAVLDNGFAAALDIPGFNYKPQHYEDAYAKLPQKMILGSETASTVSSRGVYHFPVEFKERNVVMHPDNQSNSYDNETCSWSNTPDIDFAMDDDKDWVMGQFVWTGFDYLGEPSPYDTDAWPSHSSVFGIIDLASLPKDRYYLYRSKWNETDTTLHILPHWNWKGREGEVTPVFVYTNFPKAELFINGKSQGVREKNDSTYQNRYRLMWMDTRYEPGEVKVVAYDAAGNKAAERVMRTAGKAHHLVVTPNRNELKADGDDLVYFTVQVADKDGNIVPTDNRMVKFSVSGAGEFEATANGDPTCLLPFQNPEMKLFSGAATAIARSGKNPGTLTFKATAPGVKPATVTVQVK